MGSPQIKEKPSSGLLREEWRFDYQPGLGKPAGRLAATLVLPDDAPQALLFCLPGGYLSRRYYDLQSDDGSFSFAAHMAGRGFATLALDHLGIGDSDRPRDGWALDVDALCEANQFALEEATQRIGDLVGVALPTVGVGHSMGSSLTVAQQARSAPHSALVLFSFATGGLRPFLQGREADFADRPEAAATHLAELARERFPSPFAEPVQRDGPGAGAAFSVGSAGPAAEALLQTASTQLLALPGLLSMIPGGYRLDAERVRVPSLVAIGDHDLHNEAASGPLPNAPVLDTFVLEDCWHCHHVANTRARLWDHVASWLEVQLGLIPGQ